MGDLEAQGCWMPNTPVKSASSKPQICKDSSDTTNSSVVDNGFHNWEADLMGNPLPDATATRLGDHDALSNPSDSIFRTGIEGTSFEKSVTTTSVGNNFISVGQNMWINSNCFPSTPNGDTTHSQHSFDLNTPLKGLIDAVSSSVFAPITPDQSKKAKNQACLNQPTDKQITNDSSSVVALTEVEENHNPDIDQQRTPQQKPRRKKHRPKVIKEGQAKSARKPVTPKSEENNETQKRVRKYVKKNRIDKIQGLPEATPENKEIPKVKRKYVRKNKTGKTPELTTGEVSSKCTDTKKESRELKSCKKRLNFNENSSVIEESSSCIPASNENGESQEPNDIAESQAQNFHIEVEPKSHTQLDQGLELVSGDTKTALIQELGSQERKKGRCRIVFSDKTHDKEEPIVEMMLNSNLQPAPSLNDSNYSNNMMGLNEGEEARRLKRGRECTINEAQQRCTNMIGGHYNSMSNYVELYPTNVYDGNRISDAYFSPTDKKKQPKRRRSSCAYGASYVPETNCAYSAGQYYPNGYQTQTISFSAQLQQQHFEYQLLLKHAKMMVQMGCDQVPYYLAKGASSCGDLQVHENAHSSHVRMELKVAKARKTTGINRRKLAAVRRKKKPSVDDITEYLKHLQIDPEYKDKKALVLFNGVGAVVPFEGSFNPIKKRRERAKVDLDEETSKVWRLLLENINTEGIDGTDEEKAKWWENERRVFQGRADSFIARMHLVQGDRRFSPWKGSVVDSVVGVFLTQNVSDHASSSAFMSMAAHFPIKTEGSFETCCKKTSISVKEKKMQILNPEDTINSSNQHGTKATFMELLQMAESQRKFHNSENGYISSYTKNVQHFAYQSQECTQNIARGLYNQSPHTPNGSNENCASEQSETTVESTSKDTVQKASKVIFQKESISFDVIKCSTEHKQAGSSMTNHGSTPGTSVVTSDLKKGNNGKKKEIPIDWDILRLRAQEKGKREKTANTMDSLDWEAVWRVNVDEVAATIKERGMNNVLAGRIQAFLNRLVTEHGSIDLEWLRDVQPDKAKEYLLSIRGLGLKSVECVRLLTLHHLAFPVDTNVGRIAVRLGWVPLQPLPESLQLHLLELYPVLETIQQYLWPRLCKLDQKTLYELHYQMITFGKVFCTKSKPNCNACPMRGECRHFASAFASARLALPGLEEKRIVNATENKQPKQSPYETIELLQLPEPQPSLELLGQPQICTWEPTVQIPTTPMIEEPKTPEPEVQVPESDIEDVFPEDPEEIPTIRLNLEKFTNTLQNYMERNMELQEDDMSKALVALTQEAASIPMPKLKNVNQLRTEHQVYELPDSHPLLEGLDKRQPDDPSSYLLAIWTPGETVNSIEQPESRCSSQDLGNLCKLETCFSCNSVREANSQTVRGTLLIPCRTATRGSFPLNGTYFQVNEVFADHASSIKPIDVPRSWIWNLPRRTVYFGTSIPTIFKGLSTESIQYCFWRGFVCVRGFDQKTRAPRPLIARLHFPASRLPKASAKTDEKKD